MNRCEFSKLMAGAGFAAALPKSSAQTAPVTPKPALVKPRFSVMIWTLEQKGVPIEKILETVSEAGYQGVELTHEAMYFGAGADQTSDLGIVSGIEHVSTRFAIQ